MNCGIDVPQPLIAALLPEERLRRDLLTAVRHMVGPNPDGGVRLFGSFEEILETRGRYRPRVLVCSIYSRQEVLALASLTKVWPNAATIAVVPCTAEGVLLSIRLLAMGLQSVCFQTGPGVDHAELAAAVEDGLAGAVAREAMVAVGDALPSALRDFVTRLWVQCLRPVAVADAAGLYHRHPSTLRRHLQAAGLPSIEKLISWGRVFHAASLLKTAHTSVDTVAASLDFPSAGALRNLLRRYANVTPSDIRREGMEAVFREFEHRYMARNWALQSPCGGQNTDVEGSRAPG